MTRQGTWRGTYFATELGAYCIRYKVLSALTMRISVFYGVTLCRLAKIHDVSYKPTASILMIEFSIALKIKASDFATSNGKFVPEYTISCPSIL